MNESTSTSSLNEPEAPSYGPRGYLPERAARRARKIILREQMGPGWPLAAAGTGILLAVVGIAFLLSSGPPGAPYAPAGEIAAVAPDTAEVVRVDPTDQDVLTVRGGGTVRTFAAPGEPVLFCRESRRLESAAGTIWTLEGILVGGDGESLRPAPSLVYDGVLYVDTEALGTAEPAPANPRGETAACGP